MFFLFYPLNLLDLRLIQDLSDLVSPRVPALRYRFSGRYCSTLSGTRDRARIPLALPPPRCLPLRAPGLGRVTSVSVAFGVLLLLSSITLCKYKYPYTFTEAQNHLSIGFSFAPGFSRRVAEGLKFIRGIVLFPYGVRTAPVLPCCSRRQIVYFAPYGFPTLRDCAGTPLAQLPLGYGPFWAS